MWTCQGRTLGCILHSSKTIISSSNNEGKCITTKVLASGTLYKHRHLPLVGVSTLSTEDLFCMWLKSSKTYTFSSLAKMQHVPML